MSSPYNQAVKKMGLRKSRVKKENLRGFNLGLFGIIDRAVFTSQMINRKASFPVALSFKAEKSVRDAMLEAEYRKAQAMALTRRMRYM